MNTDGFRSARLGTSNPSAKVIFRAAVCICVCAGWLILACRQTIFSGLHQRNPGHKREFGLARIFPPTTPTRNPNENPSHAVTGLAHVGSNAHLQSLRDEGR